MTSNTLDYHKTYPSLPWFVAEQLQLQLQTLWAVQEIRDHLEAQQETPASTEPPVTTAPAMKAGLLDVDSVLQHHLSKTGVTTAKTELLQRLLGVLSPDERTLAEQESRCAEALAAFVSNLSMRVQVAGSLTSTYPRPAFVPSAETLAEVAATSRSGWSDLQWDNWAIDIATKVYHENRHRELRAPSPSAAAPSATSLSEGWCHGTGDERCQLAVGGAVPCADYSRCVAPCAESAAQPGREEKPKIVVFSGGSVLWACGECAAQVDVFSETCPACNAPNPINAVRLYKPSRTGKGVTEHEQGTREGID